MRVLVVDDRVEVRQRLVALVCDFNPRAAIFEAASALDALRAFHAHRPDVVLVDVHLDEANGLDLVRRFKARVPAPRVCVMTSHPTSQHLRASHEAGADLFIDKSKDFARVLELIIQGA